MKRLALLAILSATLLVRPAWADSEGTLVPGVGQIVYHEGDVEVFGDGPDVLNIGLGAFDAFKTDPASAELRLEYRRGRKLLFLGPLLRSILGGSLRNRCDLVVVHATAWRPSGEPGRTRQGVATAGPRMP